MVTTKGQIAPAVHSGATKLRRRLEENTDIIVCPGVYDGFSARIALQVGFDALYMTGAGTSASRLGVADLGIAHLHDMRTNAEMIANLDPNGPPLIADMDTGYGGPVMVATSVEQYIRAGVAGFHIEDQVLQKRCGHLQGKEVVSADVYLTRIRAAIAARDRLQSDIVIIARTDALQPLGYDECISRLKAARAEGADVGLLEGFTSHEQARQAVKDLAPWPLMINMVENAVTPLMTVQECQSYGFRIMNFSFACLASTYTAIHSMLNNLKTTGVTGLTPSSEVEVAKPQQQTEEISVVRVCRTVPRKNMSAKRLRVDDERDREAYVVWVKQRCHEVSEEVKPKVQKAISPKMMFEVCGMQASMDIDAQAGGAAFAKGV